MIISIFFYLTMNHYAINGDCNNPGLLMSCNNNCTDIVLYEGIFFAIIFRLVSCRLNSMHILAFGSRMLSFFSDQISALGYRNRWEVTWLWEKERWMGGLIDLLIDWLLNEWINDLLEGRMYWWVSVWVADSIKIEITCYIFIYFVYLVKRRGKRDERRRINTKSTILYIRYI